MQINMKRKIRLSKLSKNYTRLAERIIKAVKEHKTLTEIRRIK